MRHLILYSAWFLTLTILLTGCAEETPFTAPDNGGTNGMRTAIFRLNIAVEGDGGMTRANDWTDKTPGDDVECKISTLHLFVVPVTATPDGEETEHWEQMIYAQARPAPTNPAEVETSLPQTNLLNLYVAANLNYSQVQHFRNGNEANSYYKLQYDTYETAIEELAPFTRGTSQRTNIAMFANEPIRVDISNIPDTDPTDGEKHIDAGEVTLKRMVAKVLLTCESYNNNTITPPLIAPGSEANVNYVPAKGVFISEETFGNNNNNERIGYKGWFRQENIRFYINNMPRQAKFRQIYTDTDNDGTDELMPNYNLRERINESVSFSPLTYNEQEINEWYYHYSNETLYWKGADLYQQSLVWNQNEYDILVENDDDYVNSAYHGAAVGLYTLENVYGVNDGDFTDAERAQMKSYSGLPFLTQVSIAAKFTPRVIFVTEEEWEEMIKKQADLENQTTEVKTYEIQNTTIHLLICKTEKVAQTILNQSLELANKLQKPGFSEDGKYPSDTFFSYTSPGVDGISFTTYGVAKVGNTGGEVWSNMATYRGGWIFYYTYLNNETDAPVERIEQAVIERNRYYILKLTGIGTIGESTGESNYIQVHTLKSPWRDGGEGELTLH